MANAKARTNSRVQNFAQKGRFGDNRAAHVQDGEIVVPKKVWMADPSLAQHASQAISAMGADPRAYVVGHPANNINPRTGAREFALQYTDQGWIDPAAGYNAPIDFSTYNPGGGNQTAPDQSQASFQPPAAGTPKQANPNWGPAPGSDAYYAQRAAGWEGAPAQQAPSFGFGGQNEMSASVPNSGAKQPNVDWGFGSPTPTPSTNSQWGTPGNSAINQQLAQATGYTGAFGSGGFDNWVRTQSPEVQSRAAATLFSAGQPNRVTWDPLALEQPFLDGTFTPSGVTPPAPPQGGAGEVPTPGFGFLDYGVGQQQLRNLFDYNEKYGQVPVGTGFYPESNTTNVLFDPRANFGGSFGNDPTYRILADMDPAQYSALAGWLGAPEGRDQWQWMENYLGQRTMQGAGPVYQDGRYVGLTPYVETPSVLEGGSLYIGSGPNRVALTLDDILSGKVPAYNAIDLALSAGYDPDGKYDTPTTMDAARQIEQMVPNIRSIAPNSGEYNQLRKPFEVAVPGFNAQVANNVRAQQAQGRQVPNVPIGPTTLAGVGALPTGATSSGATSSSTRFPTAAGANAAASDLAAARFIDTRNWSTNDAIRIIPWGGSNLQEYPGGIFLSNDGGKLVKQPNGLFLDEYGLLRDPNTGVIVNPDGSPVITEFNKHLPGGHFDMARVFGGEVASQLERAHAQAYAAAMGGQTASGSAQSAPRPSTGGNVSIPKGETPTGMTPTPTQSGLGLTPGTANPYSMPYGYSSPIINILGGSNGSGSGSGTISPDILSLIASLNLGYGAGTYGTPYYQSQGVDTTGGGIQTTTPNSETVDFRPSFGY